MRFVNSAEGRALRLRGVNARVVAGGTVRPGIRWPRRHAESSVRDSSVPDVFGTEARIGTESSAEVGARQIVGHGLARIFERLGMAAMAGPP